MKKIVLLCAGGMSTSILVAKMKEYANSVNFDCSIEAYAVETIQTTGKNADVILLGPQVGHKLKDLQAQVACPMVVIDMMAYGMMDGKATLLQAKKAIGA